MPKVHAMHRIRRLAMIQKLISKRRMKHFELQQELNDRMDAPVCSSTIDKDLFILKMDFDAPVDSSKYGIMITEEYDFLDALKNYLNLDV